MTDSQVLSLASDLVARPSVTPVDAGCQEVMIARLEALGFRIERLPSDGVSNLWARRGTEEPVFAFAGHTDVVPPGPEEQWDSPAFEPVVRDGFLYGRGAADMKGSLAAMVVATERFIEARPRPHGSIAFLVASAEETMFADGTPRVVEHLERRHEKITWCLLGEPTSRDRLGDVVKNGRRSSLVGHLKFRGRQGHVAYPELADNTIHRALPALCELTQMVWEEGERQAPGTSLQIFAARADAGAENVIPGELEVTFNVRYDTRWTDEQVKARVREVLDRHALSYRLRWSLLGKAFLTARGELLAAVRAAVSELTGQTPRLSTGGGTSDGRFIAPTGAQVVEFGPCNATIHGVNERVEVRELDLLAEIYRRVLEKLL